MQDKRRSWPVWDDTTKSTWPCQTWQTNREPFKFKISQLTSHSNFHSSASYPTSKNCYLDSFYSQKCVMSDSSRHSICTPSCPAKRCRWCEKSHTMFELRGGQLQQIQQITTCPFYVLFHAMSCVTFLLRFISGNIAWHGPALPFRLMSVAPPGGHCRRFLECGKLTEWQ